MSEFYDFSMTTLQGEKRSMSDYRGEVVLVVNTASRCGFTPQYQGLQQLYERYIDHGLVVLGFPCNQFGRQEPGNAAEIGQFCSRNYGVSFLLSEKVEVNGKNAHPLFQWLTEALPGWGYAAIKWNFTKFLIDREGRPVQRFAPMTKPVRLERPIRKLL